ncbi:MAG: helix-turn-helix transcriptional regulator [Aquincola sp.]|nr:helix-turn-helix transcriptional regulator [Aquincola sp.]
MSTVGSRLREERDRLGLTQEAFGRHGGVQKRAQITYEADERSPDAAYLSALATHGVDVVYVLAGVRSEATLSDEESALITMWRATPPDRHQALLHVAAALSDNNPARSALVHGMPVPKRMAPSLHFAGPVGAAHVVQDGDQHNTHYHQAPAPAPRQPAVKSSAAPRKRASSKS